MKRKTTTMMLLTVLVSVIALYSVDANRCRECMKISVTSDNPFMEMIMQSMFDSMSNPNCESNPNSVTTTDCGNMKCGTIDAQMDLSIETMTGDTVGMNMNMLVRGCMDNDGTFNNANGCHDVADVEDAIVASMELGEEATLNDISGDYCVCDSNNCNTD